MGSDGTGFIGMVSGATSEANYEADMSRRSVRGCIVGRPFIGNEATATTGMVTARLSIANR